VKPANPKTDNFPRVFRGGGWDCLVAAGFRAALRHTGAPADRYNSLGFRCAQRGAKMPVGKVTP
jgi:formylglycine-generating enzyme required for sulfatase activity